LIDFHSPKINQKVDVDKKADNRKEWNKWADKT